MPASLCDEASATCNISWRTCNDNPGRITSSVCCKVLICEEISRSRNSIVHLIIVRSPNIKGVGISIISEKCNIYSIALIHCDRRWVESDPVHWNLYCSNQLQSACAAEFG